MAKRLHETKNNNFVVTKYLEDCPTFARLQTRLCKENKTVQCQVMNLGYYLPEVLESAANQWQSLSHPNLHPIVMHQPFENTYMLFGTMHETVHEKSPCGARDKASVLQSCCQALLYCYQTIPNFYHGYLRPHNVFVAGNVVQLGHCLPRMTKPNVAPPSIPSWSWYSFLSPEQIP
jgi:hypothetical protein